MRRNCPKLTLVTMLALFASVVPGKPSSFEPASSANRQVKWSTRTIRIALSPSLSLPAVGIKTDSDVLGALRRALTTWSAAANIAFVEVPSKAFSISPVGDGDGVNLITVAATEENLSIFRDGNDTARTRVFFDPDTGNINEADIAINPFIYSAAGELIEFSTDATPGTYDLESTFAHEIGHLLGLEHSSVIGSTMQASQALNGTYGLNALGRRTLSDADLAAVRALYDSREKWGNVEGKILNSVDGNLLPAGKTHVWLEDVDSGRVMASSFTSSGGKFNLSGLAPGKYRAMIEYRDEQSRRALENDKPAGRRRPFRSVEISNDLMVAADKTTSLNYVLVPPNNSPPDLGPILIGLKGELSTVPVAVSPGDKLTIYVGGRGLDNVPGTGLTVSSPLITVDAASLSVQQFPDLDSVISFDITVAKNIAPGDYSLRFQSNTGETAFLVGSIAVAAKP